MTFSRTTDEKEDEEICEYCLRPVTECECFNEDEESPEAA
jgi:hypothetical protein